jgi:hypothetical protein
MPKWHILTPGSIFRRGSVYSGIRGQFGQEYSIFWINFID